MKNKKFKSLLYHGIANQIKKGIENFSENIFQIDIFETNEILKKIIT